MFKFITYSGSILALLFLFCAAVIVTDGLTDDARASDVAVVLGSKVNEDGTPSARLAARLGKAVELYNQGLCKYIIVSGGTGIEGFDESRVMKDFLIAQNIPDDKIITDPEGNNTKATAVNTAQIMQRYNFKSVIIVTQYFHIARTRLSFRKSGITNISTAHPRFTEPRDLYSTVREVVGFYKYLIFS